MRPFNSPRVAFVFDGYPHAIRDRLLELRELIFEVAEETEGVGELEETLRWGEPTYLTTESKSGSMIRIHWQEKTPDRYRMLFHCQTTLVESFRAQFPHELEFEGNRALVFREALPTEVLHECIVQALTYRLSAKHRSDAN